MTAKTGRFPPRTATETNGKGFPMAEKLYVKKGVTSDGFSLENEEMQVLNGGRTYNAKLLNNGDLIVSKGGVASRTTVSEGGCLQIFSGGSAELTEVFRFGNQVVSKGGVAYRTTVSTGGEISVWKGGLAKDVTVSSGGWCCIFSGGVASGVEIGKGANMELFVGGTATDISWTPCEGKLKLDDGGYSFASRISGVHYGSGDARLSSWSSQVSSKVVLSGGSMCVMHGGIADHVTVDSFGSMYIFSGGTATGATLSGGSTCLYGGVMKNTTFVSGILHIYSGGVVSGLSASNRAIVFVESGGTLTNCSGHFSLEVYSGGTATMLRASAGDLAVYKGAKVYNVSCGDSVYVEQGKGASIKWNSDLPLLPEPSHDCDDGWNNWLYNSKTKERNKYLPFSADGAVLESGFFGQIKPDDSNPSGSIYWNYVGYRDEVDFQKITLKSAARLSFNISAYGSVKFTIWKLTENKKGGYTLKSLQTNLFKTANGFYHVETPSILLDKSDSGTEYFVSVESMDALKTGGENYRIEMNYYADSQDKRGTCFFADGDIGTNNWLLDSGKKTNSMLVSTTVTKSNQEIKLDSGISKTIAGVSYSNFVGFGDEVDYGKIEVGADAKLTFEVTAKDAAKFTIYELLANGNRKSVLTGNCKKDHNDTEGDPVYVYTNAKNVQLKKDGNYYLCVQSTNAKKSAVGTYYSVNVLTYDTSVSSMLNETDFGMNAGLDMPDASAGDILSCLQDELNFGQDTVENALAGAASAPDAVAGNGQSGWQDLAKLA